MNYRIFMLAIVILTLCLTAVVAAQNGEVPEWARDIRGRRSATFEDAVRRMVRDNPGLSEAEARSQLEKVQRAMNSWQHHGVESSTHSLLGTPAARWETPKRLGMVDLGGLTAPRIGSQGTPQKDHWLQRAQSLAFSDEDWKEYVRGDSPAASHQPSAKHSKHNHHHHTTKSEAQLYDPCRDSQDQATCEQNRKEVAARFSKLIAESAGHNGSRRAKSPTSTRPQSNK